MSLMLVLVHRLLYIYGDQYTTICIHFLTQTSLKGPFLINFYPHGTVHIFWQTSIPCMLLLTKQDNFYHKIWGDPVEGNAFVLFTNITVRDVSCKPVILIPQSGLFYSTGQFQNCPFTVFTSPITKLDCPPKLCIIVLCCLISLGYYSGP